MLFRSARSDEEEHLSRLLFNAFLHTWYAISLFASRLRHETSEVTRLLSREVNYFQGLTEPLHPLQEGAELSTLQVARLRFYRGMLKTARLAGAFVHIATIHSNGTEIPVAVSCFYPPGRRPTLKALWNSGWISAVFRFGLIGFFRFLAYVYRVSRHYQKFTAQAGIDQGKSGFVQCIATDPSRNGHGYGKALLQWQVNQHERDHPESPIVLDTSTGYGEMVYQRLDFAVCSRMDIRVDVDGEGLARTSPDGQPWSEQTGLHCSRIMSRPAKG